MQSLEVPGDVCEIGCFRGTMSVKFAFALKALGFDKTVYAFDTFEGFTTDDPAGGQVGVGYYRDGGGAFEELMRWSKAIPLRRSRATHQDMRDLEAAAVVRLARP